MFLLSNTHICGNGTQYCAGAVNGERKEAIWEENGRNMGGIWEEAIWEEKQSKNETVSNQTKDSQTSWGFG